MEIVKQNNSKCIEVMKVAYNDYKPGYPHLKQWASYVIIVKNDATLSIKIVNRKTC
jgi:hypothetical protein